MWYVPIFSTQHTENSVIIGNISIETLHKTLDCFLEYGSADFCEIMDVTSFTPPSLSAHQNNKQKLSDVVRSTKDHVKQLYVLHDTASLLVTPQIPYDFVLHSKDIRRNPGLIDQLSQIISDPYISSEELNEFAVALHRSVTLEMDHDNEVLAIGCSE